MLHSPRKAKIDPQKSRPEVLDQVFESPLEKYLNSHRKSGKISAEELAKYTQVQCDRILEVNVSLRKKHDFCSESNLIIFNSYILGRLFIYKATTKSLQW